MPDTPLPPLTYLSAADVEAAMPPIEERLALARTTLVALVADADLPPKIAVHPRPDGSFAHAMPAHLRGKDAEGGDDLLGIKWVLGFGGNRALGLPAINATVVLNDARTGLPIAIIDGGPITARRTAAVSGVAIRQWAVPLPDRPTHVAIIGAGVQGHSHVEILGHVLAGCSLVVFDQSPDAATRLAQAAEATSGINHVTVAADARGATSDADVVITVASFGPVRQVMTNEWLTPDALVVPVDYATYCSAEVARDAALFLVDERDQFLANRDAGQFDDYPDPTATIGEALLDGTPRPDSGRMVTTHLGVGLADVVFGSAILARARGMGLGSVLPR
jgi:ornithine cyclodeaminase/alanine dehydrogenase-like protein (mu-crystallin family)